MNLEKRLKALRKRYKADKKKLIEEYAKIPYSEKRERHIEDMISIIKKG